MTLKTLRGESSLALRDWKISVRDKYKKHRTAIRKKAEELALENKIANRKHASGATLGVTL